MANTTVDYKVDESFRERIYPYPATKDPKGKGEEYHLDKSKAIYSSHIRNTTGIYYSDQSEYKFLREYGNANQSEDKYIEYFFKEYIDAPSETSEGTATRYDVDAAGGWTQQPRARRKGWMNVLFDVVSYAPKIMASLLRNFEKAEYDIVADAMDQFSGDMVEDKKYKLWAIKQNMQFSQEYHANMGVEYETPEFVPETLSELELYNERGGFKPAYCKYQEMLIKHTTDISDWGEIKKKMLADAINIGVFGCQEYFDEQTGKIKIRYIDPAFSVIQYGLKADFSDAEFAGHFEDVPVSELRLHGFDQKDIETIAKSFMGYQGNPNQDAWAEYNKQNKYGGYDYDFFKVSVFMSEWIDIDSKQELVLKNKQGKKRVIKQEYGTKNKKRTDQHVREIDVRVKYHCAWIVGTDHIYDWGKSYDILRPKKKEVNLSYHFYKLPIKSITAQLYPIYDNFMILWIKYQNTIATAVNAGYAINLNALKNLKIGGGENVEEMAVQRFLQTGILIFKDASPTAPGIKNVNIPIHQLPGSIGNAFTEFRAGFLLNAEFVENLTGFNPLIVGGSPDKDAPVKTSEMSFAATNNILGFILSGFLKVKENMAKNASLWIQLKIKQDPETAKCYEDIIGKKGIKIMRLAEKHGVQYGINLIPRPTDLERREIYESAKISLSNGREGKPGINEANFFSIMHILNSGGSLKYAEMVLEDAIRKSQQQADKVAKENMQIQQQGAQQVKKQEIEGKLLLEKSKADLEARNDSQKHLQEMEQIRLKGQIDKDIKTIEAANKPAPAQVKA